MFTHGSFSQYPPAVPGQPYTSFPAFGYAHSHLPHGGQSSASFPRYRSHLPGSYDLSEAPDRPFIGSNGPGRLSMISLRNAILAGLSPLRRPPFAHHTTSFSPVRVAFSPSWVPGRNVSPWVQYPPCTVVCQKLRVISLPEIKHGICHTIRISTCFFR